VNIHILGIGGTFMAGIARLATELGHAITGSDGSPIYPPMSTQIEKLKIPIDYGYSKRTIPDNTDLVIVGNSLSRGNPVIEKMLEDKIPFTSGPSWLGEAVLGDRRRIVVSGTHGKTTVSSLITWMLAKNGYNPGFLIGGIPGNFEYSAGLGEGDLFVVEGDEYDSAFFDKRPKFIHYRPDVLVINNLEHDHADIYANLSEIVTQFHHMIRTMSSSALIIRPQTSPSIDKLLEKGCWSSIKTFGGGKRANLRYSFRSSNKYPIKIENNGNILKSSGIGIGKHNASNLAAALLVTKSVGLPIEEALLGAKTFHNVKRRLEYRGKVDGVSVYDDFAHHPTAIRATVDSLKMTLENDQRLIAIIEPRSNTMKMGHHKKRLGPSLKNADLVGVYSEGNLGWDPEKLFAEEKFIGTWGDAKKMALLIASKAKDGDKVLIMSNGAVGNLHKLLLDELRSANRK